MLNKDQLIFDPTGADTTECDTVGSYILDGAGNTISSTDLGGGTQALDVNIAGGALNATVDLDFATDQVDASGSVVALDAATLAALEDITATVTGTVALDAATLAALEEITVTATDLDIRDLTAATDSVSISDGTDTLAVNADGSINVNFSPTGKQNVVETNNAIAASAAAVTTTAAAIVGTALADRTTVLIQNLGSRPVYIGDSGVTSTNGVRIPKGGSAEFKMSDAIAPFAVTDAGTADLRILELACS